MPYAPSAHPEAELREWVASVLVPSGGVIVAGVHGRVVYTFQANAGARRFYERHGFVPVEFTDGQANEERCPDVLYELQDIRTDERGSNDAGGRT